LTVLVLAGCGHRVPADEEVIATVGGKPVKAGLFARFVQELAHGTPGQLDPAYRERLLQELGHLQLAAGAAEAELGADGRRQLELQRIRALVALGADKAGVYRVPDEATLRQAYEVYVRSLPAAEYRVAHILVPTEVAALGILRQLSQGAPFGMLARTASLDESRDRGGEIGWIRPGKLPVAFTQVLPGLKAGDYTRQPVQTPYGWHVIQLLERRAATPPVFDAVRAQLAVTLEQERYERYLKQFGG
jgi:peptidyl-prolyl cis-trans isomerase C